MKRGNPLNTTNTFDKCMQFDNISMENDIKLKHLKKTLKSEKIKPEHLQLPKGSRLIFSYQNSVQQNYLHTTACG